MFTVDSTSDRPAANPGDGVCADSEGACTLRAAVMEANALDGPAVIHLDDGSEYVLSVAGGGEEQAATGDLDVHGDLTIRGDATIDGGGIDQVLDVHSGRLTVVGVTVTGGASPAAGGIRVRDGADVLLWSADVRDNTAAIGAGGIHAGDGTVHLVASSVSGNRGGVAGGVRGTGIVRVDHTTVASNTATNGVGGLRSVGSATLRYTTLVDNSGPVAGGIHGPAALEATVVAEQASGPGCSTLVVTSSYSADADGTCLDGSGTGDLVAVASGLEAVTSTAWGALAVPSPSSPLLGVVPIGALQCGAGFGSIDQRLFARPGTAAPGGCDIGAVEAVAVAGATVVVNHGGDDVAADPAGGVCQDADGAVGACSLRAAVDVANASDSVASIVVDPGVGTITLTRAGAGEDANSTGDLDVHDDLVVEGNGATLVASGGDRVLHVHSGDVRIEHLTVRNGTAPTGGGVRVEAPATLTMVDAVVTANDATGQFDCYADSGNDPLCSGEGGGAGIWSEGTLHLDRTTVHGNEQTAIGICGVGNTVVGLTTICRWAVGGGVHSSGGTIRNSTIVGNAVRYGEGGGLSVAGGTVAISHSTIVGNAAPGDLIFGHGVGGQQIAAVSNPEWSGLPPAAAGSATVAASVVDGAPPGCSGAVASAGWNLLSDDSCALGTPAASDAVGVVPLLLPLAEFGGPTPTMLPFADSPVVDVIPVGTTAVCDGTVDVDQQGNGRPTGGGCNIGSVEAANALPAAPLHLVVNHSGDVGDALPGDGICADVSGPPDACSLRAAVAEVNAWPPGGTITIADGVHPVLDAGGELVLRNEITIEGGGAVIDAAGSGRVMWVTTTAHVTLRDLTLRGGRATSIWGGGLRNAGTAVLERVDVVDNQVLTAAGGGGGGGGIYSSGDLTLIDVAVLDNVLHGEDSRGGGIHMRIRSADLQRVTVAGNRIAGGGGHGGGIYVSNDATVTAADSTFSGNSVAGFGGKGGGGYVDRGSLTIDRSTFSGNVGLDGSTAHAVFGTILFRSSTIADTRGTWVFTGGNSVQLQGSVVGPGASNACSGLRAQSHGHNIVFDTSCGFTQPGDVQGVDADLEPLADNGGPTLTHLLRSGSPALDLIVPGTTDLCDGWAPFDQRGFARPAGPGCDAGSVERQPFDP